MGEISSIENILMLFIKLTSDFGLKIFVAVLIIIIGNVFIRFIKKVLKKIFIKRAVEQAVSSFLLSLINGVLWVLVFIAALSHLGVQTASFVAVLGAAGLAIGLALQGSLSNLAAGFLIIILKPFKVGEAVEVSGNTGVIDGINLFNTEMRTFDNRKIIIPNSQIMNNTIINITCEDTRRVDFEFNVSPQNDIQKVKDIIKYTLENHQLILTEPNYLIRMSKSTHSSLDFIVRAWCNTADYWTVFFDITENIKEEFQKQGILYAVPKNEVYIVGN